MTNTYDTSAQKYRETHTRTHHAAYLHHVRLDAIDERGGGGGRAGLPGGDERLVEELLLVGLWEAVAPVARIHRPPLGHRAEPGVAHLRERGEAQAAVGAALGVVRGHGGEGDGPVGGAVHVELVERLQRRAELTGIAAYLVLRGRQWGSEVS